MATITPEGAIPADPQALLAQTLAAATALSPGLTATLPGSLIEDLSSTSTGALIVQDQSFCDLVNSISPYNANEQILTELGNVYGVQQGVGSNTSVYVTFTGTPGFVINVGVIVSDGTYQYTVQDATIVPAGGTTQAVYCLAAVAGSWPVPADTVNSVITSIPAGVALSCTNPASGVPGQAAQDIDQYRVQVIQAGNAVGTGLPTLVKTALQNVSGVQYNLISVRAIGGGWEIIVGGGDPYAVANAIFQSLFNISDLQPSQGLNGAGHITGTSLVLDASTTLLSPGTQITGPNVAPNTIIQSGSGTTYVVSPSQTAAHGPIASGGLTQTITINDYPDSYTITFVVPFQQTVGISVNWETEAGTNFVSNTVVAAAVQPAIQAYINSIYVGQSISLLELNAIFIAATTGILSPTSISELAWIVTINGIEVTTSGSLYAAQPEGYYYAPLAGIVVTNT